MTITATFALQNVPINADTVRQAIASLLPNGAGGLVQSGDFAVTQTSTPSMGVSVAVGRAWIKGTDVANLTGKTYGKQGQYFVLNDAAYTVGISTADPVNPRVDVIYVGVQDALYSGSNNQAVISVATGVPTSGASYPANAQTLPNNSIALAYIIVPANATSIVSSYITALTPTLARDTRKHAEFTGPIVSQTAGSGVNYGLMTADSAKTFNNTFCSPGTTGLTLLESGIYALVSVALPASSLGNVHMWATQNTSTIIMSANAISYAQTQFLTTEVFSGLVGDNIQLGVTGSNTVNSIGSRVKLTKLQGLS